MEDIKPESENTSKEIVQNVVANTTNNNEGNTDASNANGEGIKKNNKKRKSQFSNGNWKERRKKKKEKKAQRAALAAARAAQLVKENDSTGKTEGVEGNDANAPNNQLTSVIPPRGDPFMPPVNLNRKRKVALLLAYCGFGYQGLQVNPGAKTIEEELHKAMYLAGGISEDNKGDFNKISWTRACRTDKGVHAVGNIVAMKLIIEPEGIVERINSHLPSQIRVLKLYRTLNGFHCKNAVDYRVYEYIIPTYAFVPILKNSSFKFDSEALQVVNSILKNYEGTHNYWNFTINQKYTDASSSRFMRSVTCSEPFMVEDMEFVRVTFVGQSFMLHQIRKMISLMLTINRHSASPNIILNAFGKKSLNIHIAPGEFLTLDYINYTGYNRKLKSVESEFPELHIDQEEDRNVFKREVVYPAIVQAEKKDSLIRKFLHRVDTWVPTVDGVEKDLYVWLKEQQQLDESVVGKVHSASAILKSDSEPAVTATPTTTEAVPVAQSVVSEGKQEKDDQ